MKRVAPLGSVVKFKHHRHYEEPRVVFPQGGTTTCVVMLPNGETFAGLARCNSKENYCKRIGRDVSLGRALAQAAHEFPDLFKAKEEVST